MINEFLFYEDSNTKEEKMNYLNLKVQIRELIKNNFDRNVLTEVLLDLRKDLSGESQSVLIELYKDLGLHHDAYKKMGSRKWQVVSSGIVELTTMEVDESYGLIIKFINHRQSTIRKQAEIAVVNLREEGIKYFLDNTKFKIAEWQQLKLLDVLRHKPNYTPPQFALWLTSTNTHVVLFSLRLIKYYSQNGAEQSIITLLKHKNRDIQAEAIECIKDFHFVSALITLKLVYSKASNDIKIAILDAIGELGTKAEASFLENLHLTERNFNIKSKVIGTLNKIDPERILPTKNISKPDFYETKSRIDDFDDDDEFIESVSEVVIEQPIIENTVELKEEKILNVTVDVVDNTNELAGTSEEVIEEDTIEHLLVQSENITEPTSIQIDTIDVENEIDLSLLPNVNHEIELLEENKNEEEELEEKQHIEEELSIDFLPLVTVEVTFKEPVSTFVQEQFEPLFELDDDYNEHKEVIETEVLNEVIPTKDIESIDWSSIIAQKDCTKDIEVEESNNQLYSLENDSIVFTANFMSQEELDTMVLLENIAELGDCRELILLHEIIDSTTSDLVIERANELIRKFSYGSLRPNELFSAENELAESVFTEIYNLADEETKLILLNEIKSIGDAKEIHLLESIIKTASEKLVEQATEALEHIKSHLEITVQPEIETEENSLFEVDFELELNESIKRRIASNKNGSTLFDQLCSMSNSLYRKKNG
ncbi:HEAT repeat domain-containing protein [Maribacter spongiicola]|uniref:HEAT repeat domain-containing protein n=1 Tax=Maribacter spongiicola TaxID=1206753 RepID=UPI003F99050D